MGEPYYTDDAVTLYHGDCLQVLATLPDNSVDAVCTDPPYGLGDTRPDVVAETVARWAAGERDYTPAGSGFMGKSWDAFVPPVAVWDECLRVLKPGGHLLAFAGSRTLDLMALAVRLAGFEVRDSIAWLYGSGFPKSLDVAKAIERHHSQDRSVELAFTAWMRTTGLTARQIDEATGTNMGGHYLTAKSQPAIPTAELMDRLRPLLPEVPEWIEDEIRGREAAKEEARARNEGAGFLHTLGLGNPPLEVTHDAAEPWRGWGTALKPAFEPIVVARKPLAGTVATNVLTHGTGALNIDACRVGFASAADEQESKGKNRHADFGTAPGGNEVYGDFSMVERAGLAAVPVHEDQGYGGAGGASRFFPTFRYEAKAPTSERPRAGEVAHPTVKPLELMRWLVRLVTPPGGTVLEPFAGSGTTAEACVIEGFRCIAIEREADYLPLIVHRLSKPIQIGLDFGEAS